MTATCTLTQIEENCIQQMPHKWTIKLLCYDLLNATKEKLAIYGIQKPYFRLNVCCSPHNMELSV